MGVWQTRPRPVVASVTAARAVAPPRPSASSRTSRVEPIDRAVLEYFAQVALDVEGTVAQLTGERDRRLAEVDQEAVAGPQGRGRRRASVERPGATGFSAKG